MFRLGLVDPFYMIIRENEYPRYTLKRQFFFVHSFLIAFYVLLRNCISSLAFFHVRFIIRVVTVGCDFFFLVCFDFTLFISREVQSYIWQTQGITTSIYVCTKKVTNEQEPKVTTIVKKISLYIFGLVVNEAFMIPVRQKKTTSTKGHTHSWIRMHRKPT